MSLLINLPGQVLSSGQVDRHTAGRIVGSNAVQLAHGDRSITIAGRTAAECRQVAGLLFEPVTLRLLDGAPEGGE